MGSLLAIGEAGARIFRKIRSDFLEEIGRRDGSEGLAQTMGDLGFWAKRDRAVGQRKGEAFAFPKGAAARVGVQHTQIDMAGVAGAGGGFHMAQQYAARALAARGGRDGEKADTGAVRLGAVSYTRLDVYKRQSRCCWSGRRRYWC